MDMSMYNVLYNAILYDLNKNETKSQYYEPSLYIGRSTDAMYAIPTYISTIFDKKEITIGDKEKKSIGFKNNKEIKYVDNNKDESNYELSIGYHEIPKMFASELIPVINDLNSHIYNNKRLPYFNFNKKRKKIGISKGGIDRRTIELIEDKMNDFENDYWDIPEILHIILMKNPYILISAFIIAIFSIAIVIVICIYKIIRKSNNYETSSRTSILESSRMSNSSYYETKSSKSNLSYVSTNDNDDTHKNNTLIEGHFAIGKLQYDPKVILGRGCEGTVVYRGTFEGRNVAVKRVLSDLVKITTREINMLRESDSHVNVIRYFCSESDRTFKYIALELCDCSLATFIDKKEYRDIMLLDNLEILRQATEGVEHLHHLNIVHRDIKPQNILLSKNSQTGHVRVLISDFGLCTEGWIAPETFNSEASVTVSVDIFSLGCIYYYVLSNGKHPFGDTIKRQDNIIQGRFNLELILENDVAVHLIEAMIHNKPIFRPTAKSILSHPMFWSNDRKLQFFMDVSDRIEIETEESIIVENLEKNALFVVGRNWRNVICKYLAEDLRKFRTYKHDTVRDLLRAMRNKKHHYRELPDETKKSLGDIPDNFLQYFTLRFPKLLLHVYRVMKLCRFESVFQGYYTNTHTAFFKEPFDHLPDVYNEFDIYSNSSIFMKDNKVEGKEEGIDNYESQNIKNIQNDKKSGKNDGNYKKGGYIKRRKPFQPNK
ncbi:Serine/threonine-protein kinase/endoribonuclease IRE1 [Strongyloides ratti]|uniref:non-specific serine/threonine protein kinase n=1 Tax=Strongyloides ratti TaxID=34506 RepID=A0A090KW52_STRRB|nr:Serine/threonine-protein kinase/endoribonuclease IRE1 [Strongyloides ratti]CEF60106.2 Serine/threonine-protein kinase/endoribonuclease IRE1 [Strongyloides ratti]